MDTTLMREFTVFARHLNFSKAALALGIAQPTLSSHIASMEMELGFKLVQRGKPLRITPAGKQFCVECERMLASYRSAVSECRDLSRKRTGSLVFEVPIPQGGISDVFDYLLLLFQKDYPTISVRRHDDPEMSLEDILLKGIADVGLILNPAITLSEEIQKQGIEIAPLHIKPRSPYYLWMDRSHPLAANDRLSTADLDGCRFILPSSIRYQGLEDLASLAMAKLGVRVECVFWPGRYEECIMGIEPSEVMIVNDDDLDEPAYKLTDERIAIPIDGFEDIIEPCFVFLRSNQNEALGALEKFLSNIPE